MGSLFSRCISLVIFVKNGCMACWERLFRRKINPANLQNDSVINTQPIMMNGDSLQMTDIFVHPKTMDTPHVEPFTEICSDIPDNASTMTLHSNDVFVAEHHLTCSDHTDLIASETYQPTTQSSIQSVQSVQSVQSATELTVESTAQSTQAQSIQSAQMTVQLESTAILSGEMIENIKIIGLLKLHEKLWLENGKLSIHNGVTSYLPTYRWWTGSTRNQIIPFVKELVLEIVISDITGHKGTLKDLSKMMVGLNNLSVTYPDKKNDIQILINMIDEKIKLTIEDENYLTNSDDPIGVIYLDDKKLN